MSGNTDCYQPAEKQFEITRQCLVVFLKYKHPVSIITKNALILRDLDILKEL
jgi:DNA repair photolyase